MHLPLGRQLTAVDRVFSFSRLAPLLVGHGLDYVVCQHDIGHANKPGDVRAKDVVTWLAIRFGSQGAVFMNVLHDPGQTLFGVFEGPRVAGCGLLHLQGTGGYSTGVSCFARAKENFVLCKYLHGFMRRGMFAPSPTVT